MQFVKQNLQQQPCSRFSKRKDVKWKIEWGENKLKDCVVCCTAAAAAAAVAGVHLSEVGDVIQIGEKVNIFKVLELQTVECADEQTDDTNIKKEREREGIVHMERLRK